MSPSANPRGEGFLARFFSVPRSNSVRILFSFFFAVLLTVYAHINMKVKMDMVKVQLKDIPVQFIPAPGETIALVPRETELTVDIDVEVPGNLKDLKPEDFYVECAVTKAQIDAKEPGPLAIKRNNVKTRRVVDNLNVQVIRPDMIRPDLDYYVEMDVPVHPDYDLSELVDGYRVHIPDELEKKARVRGPKKYLETIDFVKTEKIPLSNATRSFSRLVRPVLPDEAVQNDVRILSDTIRAEVQIEKRNPRSIARVPVRILTGGAVSGKYAVTSIQPQTVTVMIDDIPEEVSQKQLCPFVDLSEAMQVRDTTVFDAEIKCWVEKDSIKVVEVIPAKVKVTVTPLATAEK